MAKHGSPPKWRPGILCRPPQKCRSRRVFMFLWMVLLFFWTVTGFHDLRWNRTYLNTKRHSPIVNSQGSRTDQTLSTIDDTVGLESLQILNDPNNPEFEYAGIGNQTFVLGEAGRFLNEDDELSAGFHSSRIYQRGFLEYTKLSKKGAVLHCLLDGTSQPRTTPWKSYDQLNDWGWKPDKSSVDYSYVSDQLNQGAGIDIGDLADGTGMTWTHSQPSAHDSVSYQATNGKYYNIFWPTKGVLMAMDNHGPQYQVSNGHGSINPWKDIHGKPLPIVQLKNWSDIVFLSWASITSPEERTGLQWVLRRIIQNDLSKDIIGTIAMKRGIKPKWKGIRQGFWQYQAPAWPGLLVSEEQKEFNALLATPNVSGVVWLLVQHREQLGIKTIKSIRIWNDMPIGDQYTPSMLIEIGEAVSHISGDDYV